MKRIKLKDCKTFLMPEEWYFDNFNTHSLCGHCIVGKDHDSVSDKDNKMRVTVINDDELFTIKLTCGNMLIPSQRKRHVWYHVPLGYGSYTPIVEYACGSFRQLHRTQYKNKSLGKRQTIYSFKLGEWSSTHELYKCKFTLEDYMKQFPGDVRGEHLNDHGRLERVKEIVFDDDGFNLHHYSDDRASAINSYYHSVKDWNIVQAKIEAEADWEYNECEHT